MSLNSNRQGEPFAPNHSWQRELLTAPRTGCAPSHGLCPWTASWPGKRVCVHEYTYPRPPANETSLGQWPAWTSFLRREDSISAFTPPVGPAHPHPRSNKEPNLKTTFPISPPFYLSFLGTNNSQSYPLLLASLTSRNHQLPPTALVKSPSKFVADIIVNNNLFK